MTKEIHRWGDRAQFHSEPIPEEYPKVHLIWMTPDPLGAIAAACKMYKGEVVRHIGDVTDEERLEYLEQVCKTKLQAPFEFVQFHFLLEGVTRSFTHQLVRQRTATYAQESLRFAVKDMGGDLDKPYWENDASRVVGLPPSIAGTTGEAFKLRSEYPDDLGKINDGKYQEWMERHDMLSREEKWRAVWERATQFVGRAYTELVNSGMPAEDARGLLPHNILTRVHYTTDLRALLDHAGNRLCTQAQFEWRLVFTKIVEAIRNAGVYVPQEGNFGFEGPVHMADKLCDLFRPVCFQTGKCEFKANFDRPCSIRSRVDEFERHGVPPSEWDKHYVVDDGPRDGSPTPSNYRVGVEPIRPYEWLMDPNAAR